MVFLKESYLYRLIHHFHMTKSKELGKIKLGKVEITSEREQLFPMIPLMSLKEQNGIERSMELNPAFPFHHGLIPVYKIPQYSRKDCAPPQLRTFLEKDEDYSAAFYSMLFVPGFALTQRQGFTRDSSLRISEAMDQLMANDLDTRRFRTKLDEMLAEHAGRILVSQFSGIEKRIAKYARDFTSPKEREDLLPHRSPQGFYDFAEHWLVHRYDDSELQLSVHELYKPPVTIGDIVFAYYRNQFPTPRSFFRRRKPSVIPRALDGRLAIGNKKGELNYKELEKDVIYLDSGLSVLSGIHVETINFIGRHQSGRAYNPGIDMIRIEALGSESMAEKANYVLEKISELCRKEGYKTS